MSEIKILKDELREQISTLKTYLDDIEDIEYKIKSAISTFEEQESPEVVDGIKEALENFKSDVKKLSSEKIEETINMIEDGVESFEESDENLKKGLE